MQANKPGSVKCRSTSSSFISICRHRQTLSTYPPESGEQPSRFASETAPVYMVFQRVRFTLPPMSPPER
jgi:hypothetical protein